MTGTLGVPETILAALGEFVQAHGIPVNIVSMGDDCTVQVVTADEQRRCGPGALHFCGSADHSRDEMLATQGLTTLDLGQPEMNDLGGWYGQAQKRKICFMRLPYPEEDILSGQYRQQFPTGMQFVTEVADVAAGRRVMEAVRG